MLTGQPDKMAAFYDISDNLLVLEPLGNVRPYDKDNEDRTRVVAFWDVAHTTGCTLGGWR